MNRDIIVISLQAWDIGIGSNCKDIARHFANHNRVLYVNSPIDRLALWRHRNDPVVRSRRKVIRGKENDLFLAAENLWILNPRTVLESISRFPLDGIFDRVNRINNERFADRIRKAAEQLGFRNIILFNDGNMFRGFYLKELLNPDMYIYYSRDNFQAMKFWQVQGTRIEPALMKKSVLVLTNSDYLNCVALQYNPNSFNVGSGCDFTLYDRSKVGAPPPDIAAIPGPVIGYTGALLDLRLDPEILRYIAVSRPDWNLVLIGPEDDYFKKSSLHRFRNIHFLGTKRPEDLAGYISFFDVAINPQKINKVTIGNYPRKIDEYLALGKPVVATQTEAMRIFEEFTYLATGKEQYITLIEKALRENSQEVARRREEFARTHSWENNVAGIYSVIRERTTSMGTY